MNIKDPAGHSGNARRSRTNIREDDKVTRLHRSAYLRALIKHLFSDRLPTPGGSPQEGHASEASDQGGPPAQPFAGVFTPPAQKCFTLSALILDFRMSEAQADP